ncbi:MAG: superoxide dismutase, partial [Candidatus Diapherotrites archaeon]|nr:superoxide dismutase [Candidatus Diapherotrites archaeon]
DFTVEHKFKARPYSDAEAIGLLSKIMSAQTTDWHYNTHHKGYITKRNEIEKKLEEGGELLRNASNANYSEFGELKKRETFNANGAILHDLFWENLSGDGDLNKAGGLKKKIEEDFGSIEKWKNDFKATALAAKNSGWAVLAIDFMSDGKLRNLLVDEHGVGAIWGAQPLIACDVYEHAHYHKDRPKRAGYIDNFILGLHWERIEKRFNSSKK